MKTPQNQSSKSRQQLAEEYNIHPRTLSRRFKLFGLDINPRMVLMPSDLALIYSKLGNPFEELSAQDGAELRHIIGENMGHENMGSNSENMVL